MPLSERAAYLICEGRTGLSVVQDIAPIAALDISGYDTGLPAISNGPRFHRVFTIWPSQ
jgi:hypothetical protein